MAKLLPIQSENEECNKTLTKILQSGRINFLLGSGASLPAIQTAGPIEIELNNLIEANPQEFQTRKAAFILEIQEVTNRVVSGDTNANDALSIQNYKLFLDAIGKILEERKTNLLSKQVSIFTTNYDVLLENASNQVESIRLNDGFSRTPVLTNEFKFQPEHFFDYLQKTGNLFNYSFAIPGINLIKLHGSMTWGLKDKEIVFKSGKANIPTPGKRGYQNLLSQYIDGLSLILPTKNKFNQTLMERVYYDLLRIFANTLEIENSALLVFGFSFEDEHILEIVRRALKNPTLLVIIFAFENAAIQGFQDKFSRYNNVLLVHPSGEEKIDFPILTKLLQEVIPFNIYED